MKIIKVTPDRVIIDISHQQAGMIASWAEFMTKRELIIDCRIEERERPEAEDLIELLMPFNDDQD